MFCSEVLLQSDYFHGPDQIFGCLLFLILCTAFVILSFECLAGTVALCRLAGDMTLDTTQVSWAAIPVLGIFLGICLWTPYFALLGTDYELSFGLPGILGPAFPMDCNSDICENSLDVACSMGWSIDWLQEVSVVGGKMVQEGMPVLVGVAIGISMLWFALWVVPSSAIACSKLFSKWKEEDEERRMMQEP